MIRSWPARRMRFLLTLLFLVASQHANADIDAAHVAGASAAYKEISARLAEPAASNMPRLSHQQDGARLLTIFDVAAVVESRPHSAAGLQNLIDWNQIAQSTLRAYIFAKGAKTNEEIGTNLVTFGDEVSLATLFNLRLSVTMHQAALSFLASLPEKEAKTDARQAGFKQMVLGIYQQVSGILALEFSAEPLVAGSDVRAAEALAQDMPIVAASFSPEQKADLRAAYDRALQQAGPDAAKHLNVARATLTP